MTQPIRLPQPPRPELDHPLAAPLAAALAAVTAQRDGRRAAALLQHGVHRLGLVRLEVVLGGLVLAAEGPEAVQWLRCQGGLDLALEAPAAEGRALEGRALEGSALDGPVATVEPAADPLDRESGRESGFVNQPVEQAQQAPLEPVLAQEQEGDGSPDLAEPADSGRLWSRLTLVAGGSGASAPAPAALAPLRAWLPDARPQGAAGQDGDTLPLAS